MADYSSLVSSLGSSGGVGGYDSGGDATGASDGKYSSAATSGVGEFFQRATQGNGAGNRGFVNNVSFEGSSLKADANINDPATVGTTKIWLYVVIGVVALIVYKLFKS